MMDFLLMLLLLVVVLAIPPISPCCGCMLADGEMTFGPDHDKDCRKECRAFIEYQKKTGRRT